MAYYKLTSCPYCKHNIPSEFLKRGGWNDIDNILGAPSGECTNCGKTFLTGKQSWSKLSSAKRIELYLRMLVGILYGSVAYSFILMVVLFLINKIFNFSFAEKLFASIDNNYGNLLFFIVPFFFWFMYTHYLELMDMIKKYP